MTNNNSNYTNHYYKFIGMKRILLNIFPFIFFMCANLSVSYSQIISGGMGHSIAVCNNGLAMGWGDNGFGQLGIGTITNREISPLRVSGLSGIRSIQGGAGSTIALTDDSTVWTWGDNDNGQLGHGDNLQRIVPARINTLTGIVAISSNLDFTLALKDDGTVWSWGANNYGQLGDGSTTPRSTPIQVPGLADMVAVSAGDFHSVALRSDGTVWAWGYNLHGEIGDSTTIDRHNPVQVHNISQVIKISSGAYHNLALKSDGTLWGWGSNVFGQLGLGAASIETTPILIPVAGSIASFACGGLHSFFIRADSSLFAFGKNDYGQLGIGNNVDQFLPTQISSITGVVAVAAGGYHSLFLRNDGTLWSCGLNDNGQVGDSTTVNRNIPVKVRNLCHVEPSMIPYDHYISGKAYIDSTNDCMRQPDEAAILFLPVFTIPGNNYTISNGAGYFSLGISDSTSTTVTPVIPQLYQHMIANPCPSDYLVYLNSAAPQDSSGFDFGFDGNLCWQLRVDVSANRKRRCFRNYSTLTYWNEGLIAADSVEVRVKFAGYDIPVAASMAYTIDTSDSSLVFNIGTLQPWQSGTITITDSIACVPGITGLTKCTEAWILPVNQCLIDSTTGAGWDHSSMVVDGECVNDTCVFVIENHGSGNMSIASQYRIYANNVMVYTGSFQLLSGDSLVVLWVSGGATIRLEADQHPDHPGNSHPNAVLEGCGTDGSGNFTIGQINLVPQDDGDIDVEIDCMQISDSYDPNDKANAPEGIDAAHIVLPNTPIDYTVRFQNTGTDTAYKVVIIDSLSNDLDLATLELGAASHPFTTSLSGQGVAVLKFTFNNINLIDSTTDELNSHGFIKYKITPKASIPLGTQINNAADIYFDYNFPVRTNNAFITLGNYLVLSSNEPKMTKAGSIIFYPNPTSGSITLESSSDNPFQEVNVYSFDGRLVKSFYNLHSTIYNLDLQGLSSGIYFIDCLTKSGSQKVKVVKY
jgi:uncharacterized repeat protein (TIGR01451 family)